MPVVTLPNGMVVESASKSEALFLYNVFFGGDDYVKHGLELRSGDIVFDVGANIGLFSAALAKDHAGLRLVLFEPVPDTFTMLERNSERLLGNATVTLVQAGVSSAPGKATFEVDRGSSMGAAASPFLREIEASSRSARQRAGLLAWARAGVADGERAGLIPARAARRLNAALDNRLLRPVALALAWALTAAVGLKRRFTRTRVVCELTTVSQAMRQHGIDRIDLLKIDAEGAEWEVLQGIDESDWPRIRQLTVEVHVTHLVDRTRAFLEDKGYEVIVDRDDWQLGEVLGFQELYARRADPGASTSHSETRPPLR
jgi:FkbM family methyltransferase